MMPEVWIGWLAYTSGCSKRISSGIIEPDCVTNNTLVLNPLYKSVEPAPPMTMGQNSLCNFGSYDGGWSPYVTLLFDTSTSSSTHFPPYNASQFRMFSLSLIIFKLNKGVHPYRFIVIFQCSSDDG